MPVYEYRHNEASECIEPVEVFQKMSDEPLTHCPECGKSVYKTVSMVKVSVKQAPFNEGEAFKNAYTHKLGRKVEKGDQLYEVPNQPGGGGGEILNLKGMTSGQKEAAITDAHARAGDTRITELGEKVEVTN